MRSNLKIELLSDCQKDDILDAAFSILENTGCRIHYDKALELLVENGCTADGITVKIPRSLVKRCIDSVPKVIQMYDRNGKESMTLGGRNTYFGAGPTCCFFYDPYTGERRKPEKQDAANTAKLTDALPHLDYAMSLCMIADKTPTLADVHELDAMVRNTTKPICTWAFNPSNLRYMLEMCAVVAGGKDKLAEKPFVIVYSEPTSPMVHEKEALQKVFVTTEYGIPTLYTPGMIMGATSPVTLAGSLAVGFADTFVGLVINQLLRPGAPFMGGTSGTPLDMTTMQTPYGAPATSLLLGASNEILHYLGIPAFDMAGSTESKTVDAQAGIEASFQTMLSLLTGGNLVHDAGFMDIGMTGSLTMLCVCNEIIGMAKRYCAGIEVNEDRIGLEYIEEVGPGGNFLHSEQTMEYFRTEFYYPDLLERRIYDAWKEDGALTMEERAAKKVRMILASHEPEALAPEIQEKLDKLVAEAENSIR
ncbi:MAG: trimethylamine methyltransferase family protein [Lachnospiraceae bacterium]|nr:trimethylamine methyltransferase family protein [Lachnospiraceae bacterium]